MITQIKIFESHTQKQNIYWLLPLDNRFDIALYKIGGPKKYLNLNKKNTYESHFESYVYIGYGSNKQPSYMKGWGYGWYNHGKGANIFKEHNFKFGGNIDISDIELIKYDTDTDTKMFNL